MINIFRAAWPICAMRIIKLCYLAYTCLNISHPLSFRHIPLMSSRARPVIRAHSSCRSSLFAPRNHCRAVSSKYLINTSSFYCFPQLSYYSFHYLFITISNLFITWTSIHHRIYSSSFHIYLMNRNNDE